MLNSSAPHYFITHLIHHIFFTSTALFWEFLNWVKQSRGVWLDSEGTSATQRQKKKNQVWLGPRLAPSALGETDCLCTVVVLKKHCSTHVYPQIYSYLHIQSPHVSVCWSGTTVWGLKVFSSTHALCLCRASCGLTSHTLCRPDLLAPPHTKKYFFSLWLNFFQCQHFVSSAKCVEKMGECQSKEDEDGFGTDTALHGGRKCFQGPAPASTLHCHIHNCQFKFYHVQLKHSSPKIFPEITRYVWMKDKNEQTLVWHKILE